MRRRTLGITRICVRKECSKKFEPHVHNMKFCSKECCRIVTNEKLLKRYYERKKPIRGERVCAFKQCQTILSKYNKDDYCYNCKEKNNIYELKNKK